MILFPAPSFLPGTVLMMAAISQGAVYSGLKMYLLMYRRRRRVAGGVKEQQP